MKVLITGVTGQDGSILASKLHSDGHQVFGGFRRGAQNSWRMRELGLNHALNFVNYDATDTSTIDYLISKNRFDFVYHFAGSSFTVDSLNFPQNTLMTNINGSVSLLEAIRKYSPTTHVFLASSSEIYRRNQGDQFLIADEKSAVGPTNPYGVSHLALLSLAEIYRTEHNLGITLGIFFNHESKYRSLEFVTRKITHGMAEIWVHKAKALTLGNFSAVRDWGCAFEFMDCARALTESRISADVVIARGELSSVRNLVNESAKAVGFDPIFILDGMVEKCLDNSSGRLLAISDERFYRKNDLSPLVGNVELLQKLIGRKPSKAINLVIEEMSLEDLRRVNKE